MGVFSVFQLGNGADEEGWIGSGGGEFLSDDFGVQVVVQVDLYFRTHLSLTWRCFAAPPAQS